MLRKIAPLLIFLALGLVAATGPRWFRPAINALYQATSPKPKLLAVPEATAMLAVTGDTAAWRMVEAIRAHNATLENATGAEIAAGQQAGGWVPSGTVGSKYIAALGALILMVLAIWQLQKLTHPEPTRWAKEDYTTDFKSLTPVEKFEVYGRVRLQYVLLAAAALVFAALVI